MRLVERPSGRPGFCAVISGKAEDPEGFIHTGQVLPGWDPEVTLSATAVREAARLIGFPTREEHTEARARIEELEREVDDLKEQLAEADRELNAVHVLKNNRAWSQAQRQGRPKKEATA